MSAADAAADAYHCTDCGYIVSWYAAAQNKYVCSLPRAAGPQGVCQGTLARRPVAMLAAHWQRYAFTPRPLSPVPPHEPLGTIVNAYRVTCSDGDSMQWQLWSNNAMYEIEGFHHYTSRVPYSRLFTLVSTWQPVNRRLRQASLTLFFDPFTTPYETFSVDHRQTHFLLAAAAVLELTPEAFSDRSRPPNFRVGAADCVNPRAAVDPLRQNKSQMIVRQCIPFFLDFGRAPAWDGRLAWMSRGLGMGNEKVCYQYRLTATGDFASTEFTIETVPLQPRLR